MAKAPGRGQHLRWFGAFIVLPLVVWFEAARRAGFQSKSVSNLSLEPVVVAVGSSVLFAGWYLLSQGRLRPLVGIVLLVILSAGAIAVQHYVPGLRE